MSATTSSLDQEFKREVACTCILLSVEKQLEDAGDNDLELLELFSALDDENAEEILREALEKSQDSLDKAGIPLDILPLATVVDTAAYHLIECMRRYREQKG